jgi:hypothetical protein|eukprot:COSAG06_NODE_3650_length_5069_cov_2.380483_4_plen_387_part_00
MERLLVAAVIIAELAALAALLAVLCCRKKVPIADAEGFLQRGLLEEEASGGGGSRSAGVGTLLPSPATKVHRGVIFVTIGMFSGYASLNLLQHHLMDVMRGNIMKANAQQWPVAGLGPEADWETSFKHAAATNYIGNLTFRIAHNFFFACLLPRHRVYISLFAMTAAMSLLGVGCYVLDGTSLAWVYLAYGFGGIGIGTFESNLLSSISSLGHDTKVWAIIGMPVGFVSISVVGFLLRSPPPLGAGMNPAYLYLCVVLALVNGTCWFIWGIPVQPQEPATSAGASLQVAAGLAPAQLSPLRQFADALRPEQRGRWLPMLRWNCLALAIDMYAVSFFCSIPFYVYNDDHCADPSQVGTDSCSMYATPITLRQSVVCMPPVAVPHALT